MKAKIASILVSVIIFLFSDLTSIYGQKGSGLPADSAIISPFGKVYIYTQGPLPKYVAIMISGDGGWKSGVLGFAETFSEMNTLVIGVDILKYYKELRKRADDCYHVSTDFVELATAIEKKYNFPSYTPPLLMGYSSGATLVYGILSQARPGTFTGGISVGFCPDIELPKMFCESNGLKAKVLVEGKSFLLQPDEKLGNPWIVLQGKLDRICNFTETEEFVKNTANSELIPLPKVGHGFAKWSDFMPQWKDAYKRLIEKSAKVEPSPVKLEEVKDLPLLITTTKIQMSGAPVALLISGDGGWYGFEQSIADDLAKYGIPTIGLDSKKYFWKRRSPEETTADLAKALIYYGKLWEKEHFLLVGYSLGADLVPFIINRLPEEIKSRVSSAVLLSPGVTTDFEIHISNMIGIGNRQNTYNVPEEIKNIKSVQTLLIFGSGEKSEVPELLKETPVTIRLIPGDHHYKFNLALIIQTMREGKAF
jgi:type IV secretory pathway VirJ component